MVVKIGKEIFGDDFKKGDYLKRLKQKGTTKDLTKYKVKKIKVDINKKAIGGSADTKEGSTDFGMLSVKYGIDENPDETRADFIAGATKGKKPKTADAGTGKFMVKGMGAAIRGGLTKGSS